MRLIGHKKSSGTGVIDDELLSLLLVLLFDAADDFLFEWFFVDIVVQEAMSEFELFQAESVNEQSERLKVIVMKFFCFVFFVFVSFSFDCYVYTPYYPSTDSPVHPASRERGKQPLLLFVYLNYLYITSPLIFLACGNSLSFAGRCRCPRSFPANPSCRSCWSFAYDLCAEDDVDKSFEFRTGK